MGYLCLSFRQCLLVGDLEAFFVSYSIRTDGMVEALTSISGSQRKGGMHNTPVVSSACPCTKISSQLFLQGVTRISCLRMFPNLDMSAKQNTSIYHFPAKFVFIVMHLKAQNKTKLNIFILLVVCTFQATTDFLSCQYTMKINFNQKSTCKTCKLDISSH